MGVLIGGFLVIFGLVFFLVGGIPLVIAASKAGAFVVGAHVTEMIFAGLGGVLALIGVVLVVTGLASARKSKAKAMMIYEMGTQTKATVTFVDRNYSLLVNNQPIFSIVEFKFKDTMGTEHVDRKSNVESELVIRNQIEVGSSVDIKYLPDDPTQTVLMIADPSAVA